MLSFKQGTPRRLFDSKKRPCGTWCEGVKSEDIGRDAEGSFLARSWPTAPLIVFTPIIPIILFLIMWLGVDKPVLTALLWTVGLLCFGALAIAAVLAAIHFFTLGLVGIMQARDKKKEELPPWYLSAEELGYLTSPPEPRPPRIGDLPRGRRTIRLRFLDLKARVCRPFAS